MTTTQNTTLEIENLQSIFSDFHKDVYGYRPRFMSVEEWNDVSYLTAQIKRLDVVAKDVFAEEARLENERIAKFEEKVAATIECGAKTRKVAIRWLMESEGEMVKNDHEYFCFLNGLPYGYFKKETV